MSDEQEIHKIYMFITFVSGIILTAIAGTAFDHMKDKCHNNTIRRGMTTIMALGVAMLSIAFAFYYCNRDKDIVCNVGIGVPKLIVLYQLFATIIAGIILLLSIMMWMKYEKMKNKNDCGKHLNAYLIPIIIICTMVGMSNGYFIIKRFYGKND